MNKENQIYLLKKFIKSNEDTIVINLIDENITILYLYFIRYFADKQGVKINTNINTETKLIEDDLFGLKQIQIFNVTSQSKLIKAMDMKDKKIVFTDYKNYKRIDSKITKISSYQYENVEEEYMSENLNIKLEKNAQGNFFKRISVLSSEIKMSIYLNECKNSKIKSRFFIHNPFFDYKFS